MTEIQIFTLAVPIVAVVMIVGAVLLYRAGVSHKEEMDRFLRTGTHSRGVVMGFEVETRHRGDHGSTFYYPVVRFQGPNGVIETRTQNGTDYRIAKEGEERDICYDPAQPTRVIVTDSKMASPNTYNVIMTVVSVMLAVMGVVTLAAWVLVKVAFR